MNDNFITGGFVATLLIITGTMVCLKLFGFLSFGWITVLAPLWIPALLLIAVLIIFAVIYGLILIFNKQ